MRTYLATHVDAEYVYHDLSHTEQVVEHARQLGPLEGLRQEEQQLLELAAWFHDTGYDRGPDGHELRSCINAKAFLRPRGLHDDQLDRICQAIEATRLPPRPRTVLGQLLCDADMGHLGSKNYWDRCRLVRQELLMTKGVVMSESQWIDFELAFMAKHRYFTESGMELFGKRKRKHVKQLRKQELQRGPTQMNGVEALAKRDRKKKKRRRAVDAAMRSETTAPPEPEMDNTEVPKSISAPARSATATSVSLLRAAIDRTDRQANWLLVGSALAVVLVVIGLVPSMSTAQGLLFPGLLLLFTCLATVAVATTAVRMPAPDGREAEVLRRKHDYLSTAYVILLCGLVAAVLVFAVALII